MFAWNRLYIVSINTPHAVDYCNVWLRDPEGAESRSVTYIVTKCQASQARCSHKLYSVNQELQNDKAQYSPALRVMDIQVDGGLQVKLGDS